MQSFEVYNILFFITYSVKVVARCYQKKNTTVKINVFVLY